MRVCSVPISMVHIIADHLSQDQNAMYIAQVINDGLTPTLTVFGKATSRTFHWLNKGLSRTNPVRMQTILNFSENVVAQCKEIL